MHSRRRHQSGMSLIEVLIAMGILAAAAGGALAGLVSASQDLREGHVRNIKTMLLDAKLQRLKLSDKARLAMEALPWDATAPRPDQLPLGAPPWSADVDPPPSTDPFDVSTGAYFQLAANGEITRVALTGFPCGMVPVGVYCREVALVRGLPVTPTGAARGILPAASQPYTYWVRISRGGEPLSKAIVHREVIIQ